MLLINLSYKQAHIQIKMARILFSLSSYGTGGKEKQLTEIIRGMRHHSIHLLCKNYSGHFFPSIRSCLDSCLDLGKKRLSPSDLLRIKRYVKGIKPDIVIPFCFTNANIMLSLKHIFLMKYHILNYTIRDVMPFGNRSYLINRIFLNLQKHVIANSLAGLKAYRQDGKKGRYVIRNGYDTSKILKSDPSEARKALNLDDDSFIISMIARLDRTKDHDTLLQAASYLKDKGLNDMIFLITGDGEKREYLADRIISLGIEDSVKMLGYRKDIENILIASDISLLLSYSEGIPNSILESFAYRRPVIATGSGGIPEIIEDGSEGFILDQGNYKAIAEKILFLRNNPEMIQKMGNNGYNKLLGSFRMDRLLLELEELIVKLL